MPLDNGKVMVSWPLAETILSLNLTAPTLRLAFSMLHRLDLAGCCGPESPNECPFIWSTCKSLRERVGPKRSKGAREIRAAAKALTTAGVLEQFALLKKGKVLQWQFGDWVWASMRDRDWSNYVLIDLKELAKFGSTYRISLYLIARKVRDSNAPEFIVRYDETISEEANTRRLLSALRLLAEELDVICYAALEMRSHYPAPAHIRVRMTHSATLWHHHGYAKFKRPKAVWRVDRAGHQTFDPESVRDARADRMELIGLLPVPWTRRQDRDHGAWDSR